MNSCLFDQVKLIETQVFKASGETKRYSSKPQAVCMRKSAEASVCWRRAAAWASALWSRGPQELWAKSVSAMARP